MQKYEFTDETCEFEGHTLHRIRAMRDFGHVKAGDLGGWIEWKRNLSHDGTCWVQDEAKVMGWAQVKNNAIIRDNAIASWYARIVENAIVEGDALIEGLAAVGGYARISQMAIIGEQASVRGHACVNGCAQVCGKAEVSDYAKIEDYAIITGHTSVSEYARICENAAVQEYARVRDHAVVGGEVIIIVNGTMILDDDAHILHPSDLLWISNISSFMDSLTFYRCKDNMIRMTCGGFHGTCEEFQAKIAGMNLDERDIQEYHLAIELAKAHIR